MKNVNDLVPQNKVKDKAPTKEHEHVMALSGLCLIITVLLIFIPSLILFLVVSYRKKVS